MGNQAMKTVLDPRHFKSDCGFYVYDEVFDPVVLEVKTKRGDRAYRYRWKYQAKKGNITYNMPTPNRRIFTDVLQVLGFTKALESDLHDGLITMENGSRRDILVYIPRPDLLSYYKPGEYVDQGVLQPVKTSIYRGVFDDPVTGERITHRMASISFRGKKLGDIIYHRDTSNRDVFKLKLRKIGYGSMRDRRFKNGVIDVDGAEYRFRAYTP
jgi:hypothetical protein